MATRRTRLESLPLFPPPPPGAFTPEQAAYLTALAERVNELGGGLFIAWYDNE